MQLSYYKEKTSADLPETIFEQDFNEDLVHQLVNTVISNNHSGTKSQKNRSDVSGGGKKPWRQKGTGRARAGTIRSPIWRGGGVTFAHNYVATSKKINKKMYKAALRSIFSKLLQEERIIVLDSLQIDEPAKTSKVKAIVQSLNLTSAVFILPSKDENLIKASNNLYGISIQTVHSIDPTKLIKSEKVVLLEETLKAFEELLV